MDHYTRRIIGFGIHVGVVNGEALCRMFKQAIRGVTTLPRCLSSDHDPLYRFHQWEANLRILGVREIKTVPYVPWSHPFIERLIGTIRRECLDRSLFWTSIDLEMKLVAFQDFYNKHRTHSALEGQTPIEVPESKRADLKCYRWRTHCRGLYQTPIAA
jgi:transposase InsO family protein